MKKLIILLIPIILLTGCSVSIEDNSICDREKCEKAGGTFTETIKDCICTYDRLEKVEVE